MFAETQLRSTQRNQNKNSNTELNTNDKTSYTI